jgi:hypothetical protein
MIRFLKPHVFQAGTATVSVDPAKPQEGHVTVHTGDEMHVYVFDRLTLEKLGQQIHSALERAPLPARGRSVSSRPSGPNKSGKSN